MKSTADLLAMKAELSGDPEGLGYVGDDASDAAIVSALRGSISIERFDIPLSEVAQSVNRSEFTALAAADRQWIDLELRGETVDGRTGSESRTGLLALFDAGTTTRTNLQTLLTRDGSRAEELYQAGTIENASNWTPSDIANARRVV